MLWWPSDDVVSAVIDGEGPWPSLSPVSNGLFVPFDVDKYDGLAVVIGYGRNRKGREVLGWDEFQQNEAGTWEHLSGGGSGWSPRQRWDLPSAREALHFRMGDRLESRHSMPDARFPLRCSCVDQRSLPSKSTVGTASESPMSAQDPAGSPSCGLPMTQPWCGPTPQTDGSLSSGLHRTMAPEGNHHCRSTANYRMRVRALNAPVVVTATTPDGGGSCRWCHIWDRSTSNSQPGEAGSKPCSISHRAATRLRSDHQARITSRSTSAP